MSGRPPPRWHAALLVVAAACGPEFESSVITCDEARSFAYTPARRGDPVSRSGPIVAGEEIPVYRIERIAYDADELVHRAIRRPGIPQPVGDRSRGRIPRVTPVAA